MNLKNLIIGAIIVFIGLFATDFIIHGQLLKSFYIETPSLWRSETEMQSKFGYMLLGQFLISLFFYWIFTKGYQNKGIGEGVRFGLLIGGIEVGRNLIMHAVYPYPTGLSLSWGILAVVQAVVLGMIAALAIKKFKV